MQEVFRTDSNHVITKKYDIQSFDEELMGHTIYKGIFSIKSSGLTMRLSPKSLESVQW